MKKWVCLWKLLCVCLPLLVAGMLFDYDSSTDDNVKKAHYGSIRQLAADFKKQHDTICRPKIAESIAG